MRCISLDGLEEDLKKVGTRSWRRKAVDEDERKKVLTTVKPKLEL